ncbi:calcium-binding protein [Microvirga sp. 2MCAF35]|uniref:calcium-binding protein n=1 Tax=Microvirga sp. 2MCAF35 TaxID=3232987 RepID=UPI003F97D5E9
MASTVPSKISFQGVGSSSHVTRYSDGSFLTVWTTSDDHNAYVYGRVFNTDGTVKKDTFLIDSKAGASYTDVNATALSDGRTVIAWTTNDGLGKIVGKVLNGMYTPASELLGLGYSPASLGQSNASVYALANGGFTLIHRIGYSPEENYGSVYSEGPNGWESIAANLIRAPNYPEFDHHPLAALSNGLYAGTYLSSTPEGPQLCVRILSSEAQPTFHEKLSSSPVSLNISSVTPLNDGHFIVAWLDGNMIRTQTFGPDGSTSPQNAISIPLPEGQLMEAPVISQLENGGFAIAFRVYAGNGDDVYTTAFAADGSVIAGLTHVGTSTELDQWNPSIIALKGNSYAVSWLSETDTGSQFFVEVIGVASEPLPPLPVNSTWTGTDGDDTRIGTDLSEIFKGLGGKDNIDGGAGNDTIWGGAGNDTLKGNAGLDIFVFDTKPNKNSNKDKIADFQVRDDSIWLDNKAFTKLGKKGTEDKPTQISKAFFTVGSKAKDKNDYIIYDKAKGILYYDADGSGKGKAVEFAQLPKKLAITYKDFFVI